MWLPTDWPATGWLAVALVAAVVAVGGSTATVVTAGIEVPGEPGVDYPAFPSAPSTSFQCTTGHQTDGYYADVESRCQVKFHYISEVTEGLLVKNNCTLVFNGLTLIKRIMLCLKMFMKRH